MEITVNGQAFAMIEVPEELVRAYNRSGKFEGIWCKKMAEEVMNHEPEDYTYLFHVEDVLDALQEAREYLEQMVKDREKG